MGCEDVLVRVRRVSDPTGQQMEMVVGKEWARSGKA